MKTARTPLAALIAMLGILSSSSVARAGSPGCPPSLCPPVDAANPDGIARLTLFPGTASVVHDNGPGDLDPDCGVLVANNIPFPGAPYASGTAVFSGTVVMRPPDPIAGLPGQLIVTDAIIHNESGAAGGDEEFQVQSPLPLACGEFFNTQGTIPATLRVDIDGTLETDNDADSLAGGEEFNVEARALTFTTTSPIPSLPPGALFVEVFGPPSGSQTPGPYPLSTSGMIFGTYAPGPGVIGLIMGGVLPSGELIRLPNSIDSTFGHVTPPIVPGGGQGTTPLTVAKLDPAGSMLSVNWDATSCDDGSLAQTTLIYGGGSGLPGPTGAEFQPAGALCDIGQEPPFVWDDVPDEVDGSGMLWWLVLRLDEQTATEGSWSTDSMGVERDGPGPNGSSGQCGTEDKQTANVCEP